MSLVTVYKNGETLKVWPVDLRDLLADGWSKDPDSQVSDSQLVATEPQDPPKAPVNSRFKTR